MPSSSTVSPLTLRRRHISAQDWTGGGVTDRRKADRRSSSLANHFQRLVWPRPVPLVLGLRIAPLAVVALMWAAMAWSSPAVLFGVLPPLPTMGVCSLVVLAGAVWLPLRPFVLVAVTVSILGLSMTLLLSGSSSDVFPRRSELLGSALYGSIWLLYFISHVLVEVVRVMSRELDDLLLPETDPDG